MKLGMPAGVWCTPATRNQTLKLRVPANRVSDIVRGHRAISPETALRLGRYFGTSAQFWMNLQANYDLAIARQELGATIDREVELA